MTTYTNLEARIDELTQLVHNQQQQISLLTSLLNGKLHPTSAPGSQTERIVPRKNFLKKAAAALLVGASATGATILSSQKAAEAKLAVSTHPNIGILALSGSVTYTGSLINPNSRYGLVASAKNANLNLSDLYQAAECGIAAIATAGAGVWGRVEEGDGIRGEVSGQGFGIVGDAITGGIGVGGASTTGFGVTAQSLAGIPLYVWPSPQTPTIPQNATAGAIYFDTQGNMYISQGTTWKKVATV
jgi:hypothetical protein